MMDRREPPSPTRRTSLSGTALLAPAPPSRSSITAFLQAPSTRSSGASPRTFLTIFAEDGQESPLNHLKRILIMGQRRAGKTLLWKHARLIMGSGLPDERELLAIHRATIAYTLCTLGTVCESLVGTQQLNGAAAEAARVLIQSKPKYWLAYRCAHTVGSPELDVSDEIRSLVAQAWDDPFVRESLLRHLQDEGWSSGKYVYENFETISAETYQPTRFDYLTARTCNRGVFSANIAVMGRALPYSLIDLQNLLGESKKWLHMFESVPLLFLASVDTYDQAGVEDPTSPDETLHEIALEFGRKLTHKSFVDSAVTLVLTKIDLMDAKLAVTPLHTVDAFKDYTGNSTEEAIRHIAEHFMKQVPHHKLAHTQYLTLDVFDEAKVMELMAAHCTFAETVAANIAAARDSPRFAKMLRCNSFQF